MTSSPPSSISVVEATTASYQVPFSREDTNATFSPIKEEISSNSQVTAHLTSSVAGKTNTNSSGSLVIQVSNHMKDHSCAIKHSRDRLDKVHAMTTASQLIDQQQLHLQNLKNQWLYSKQHSQSSTYAVLPPSVIKEEQSCGIGSKGECLEIKVQPQTVTPSIVKNSLSSIPTQVKAATSAAIVCATASKGPGSTPCYAITEVREPVIANTYNDDDCNDTQKGANEDSEASGSDSDSGSDDNDSNSSSSCNESDSRNDNASSSDDGSNADGEQTSKTTGSKKITRRKHPNCSVPETTTKFC